MSQSAAIRATFSEWRMVKSRKVLQLVFELPLERQAEVLTMLGPPMPDKETWCAIARLVQPVPPVGAQIEKGHARLSDDPRAGGNPKERRPWHTLPPQQRAGMLCSDIGFQKWASKQAGWECDEQGARDWLCTALGIKSRVEIATDPYAKEVFSVIEGRFMRESGRAVEIR